MPRSLVALLLLASLTGAASATEDLRGPLSDATTGPLTAGTYQVVGDISVDPGATLTVSAGAIVKFPVDGVAFAVRGTLNIQGTAENPAILTSILDDSAGGDTNGDGGATTPAAGDWYGVIFVGTEPSSSRLHGLEVRFGGKDSRPVMQLYGPELHLDILECRFRDNLGVALDLVGLGSIPKVTGCTFENNGGIPIAAASLEAVVQWTGNVATGNGGDYIEVYGGGSRNLELCPENIMGGALVVASDIGIAPDATLTLHAGVVLKFHRYRGVIADGALICAGTPENPVVFTSFHDDRHGGDTDKSATPPTPGDWDNVFLRGNDSALSTRLDHLLIRYPTTGIQVWNDRAEIRNTRIESTEFSGFITYRAPRVAESWVAHGCGLYGMYLWDSATNLVGATAAYNSVGLFAEAPYHGHVTGAIAFGNSASETVGLEAGEISYSDAGASHAGVDGNIDADPRFVDGPGGDLRLSAGSPCVDAGDPRSSPSGWDFDGFPRWMDGDLDRDKRVDMGALEFNHLALTTTGDWTPGSTVSLHLSGNPILRTFLFVGVQPASVPFGAFGELYVDLSAPWLLLPWASAPSTREFPLPPGLTPPVPLVIQVLGVDPAASGTGNVANRVRRQIE